MNTLIFATNNANKALEINAVLGKDFKIITLKEAGINIDIPEPHKTLEENASEKSGVIYNLTKKDCFSEDTGLEVDSLNGEPGVKSARYAGENKSSEDNIDLLLKNMEGKENKSAKFRTIISLRLDNQEYKFEGICQGSIIAERRGMNGFGYDPIFVPEGSKLTFAEMDMKEKNLYSHRKKAVEKLVAFMRKHSRM